MASAAEPDSPVNGRPRAALLVGLIVLGLGVAAAPAIFQMFDRAPKGGDMIDNFRPYMTKAEIAKYRGFLTEMREARVEATTAADPAAAATLGLTPAQYVKHVQYLHAFEQQFPGIDRDMGDMLDRMGRNLGNYRGVDALPPFALFPWFFVIPGLLIASGAGVAFVAGRRGRRARGALVLVVVVGVGLVLAPAVFQMFTRGPGGGDMVRDFRPIMTREKLTTVQGYFVAIGNGEAELRNVVLPAAALPATDTTALTRFSADWPRINREMAPFVGVMADNLENFAAVDALPPFALFPWFFVIPGLLAAGLGLLALRGSRTNDVVRQPGGPVSTSRTAKFVAVTLSAVALAAFTAAPAIAKSSAKTTNLKGTFGVTAASCAAGAPTAGSYFRMVQPKGTTAAGPFVPNADSACGDKTYTALQPGTAGGLVTGKYQPQPDPPFDAAGNGLAGAILAPTKFFGVNFAVSTNKIDPQSSDTTKVPSVLATSKGKLSGDVDAMGVAYGNQQFNQGAPKPDGSKPGATAGPTGTYNAKTGKYTLEWSSAIVGGPFDGFTGTWHFEGTFKKA